MKTFSEIIIIFLRENIQIYACRRRNLLRADWKTDFNKDIKKAQLFIIVIYSTFHNVHLIWWSVKSSQNSNIPYKIICSPREVSSFLRFWLLLFRTQKVFPWFVITTSPNLTLFHTWSEMTLRCDSVVGINTGLQFYAILRVILESVRLICLQQINFWICEVKILKMLVLASWVVSV